MMYGLAPGRGGDPLYRHDRLLPVATFAIRSTSDRYGSETGGGAGIFGPPTGPVSATQSYGLLSYLNSAPAIEDLTQTGVNVRVMLSSPRADFFSRLSLHAKIEDVVADWHKKVRLQYDVTKGIIMLNTYAFSANDSYALADGVLQLSERMANTISQRVSGAPADQTTPPAGGWASVIDTNTLLLDQMKEAQIHYDEARNTLRELRQNAAKQNAYVLIYVRPVKAGEATFPHLSVFPADRDGLRVHRMGHFASAFLRAPRFPLRERESLVLFHQDQTGVAYVRPPQFSGV
ncbi:hypothetical protein LV564_02345 [Komagataeibacter nataicola]|uniref:hypothetical protein n=1 Tax=Komagataeibacter nataicola TaxID=265960 RepID=UPI0023DD0DB0|nr:hypothetical protein [Komagataeibacter nataicola]WEQ57443.1 hypothetical protein LV564_02345 [Komagataeibacter nataicola]